MQNRDRLFKEVGIQLGISSKIVKEVVTSQFRLVEKCMRANSPVSVYIRPVAYFLSPQVKRTKIEMRMKYHKLKLEKRKLRESEKDYNTIKFK